MGYILDKEEGKCLLSWEPNQCVNKIVSKSSKFCEDNSSEWKRNPEFGGEAPWDCLAKEGITVWLRGIFELRLQGGKNGGESLPEVWDGTEFRVYEKQRQGQSSTHDAHGEERDAHGEEEHDVR